MLQYSFNSDTNTKNLSILQQSILREYKRLGFGEDTIQYSINSLNYQELPQNFPQQFLRRNSKCMRLSSCGFFQMLTYSVFEYLLSKRSPQKDQIIKKIRKQITEKDFMEDCPSTKGLLLKGMKMMYDYVQLSKGSKPIAHCMWKSDSILAFTEFWKSLLAKLSIRNIVTAQTTKSLDVGLFQILADYLGINFNIFYQTQGDFENQIYYSKRKISSLKITLFVYSNEKKSKNQCSRILNSSAMTQKNSIIQTLEWSYIIMEDSAEYYRSQLQRQNISQIQNIQESVNDEKEQIMKLFKCKTKSQLNYHSPNSQKYNNQGKMLPLSSQIKEAKGLETTRTKKSTLSTRRKTIDKQTVNLSKSKNDSYETQENLQTIKYCMYLGDKLVEDMKQYCQSLKI